MKLQLGDVVLIRMEFHQAVGGKVRPAVVLLDAGDADFVAAPITSQARNSEFDFPNSGVAFGWPKRFLFRPRAQTDRSDKTGHRAESGETKRAGHG